MLDVLREQSYDKRAERTTYHGPEEEETHPVADDLLRPQRVYPLLDFEQGRRLVPAPFQVVICPLFRSKYVDDNLAVV